MNGASLEFFGSMILQCTLLLTVTLGLTRKFPAPAARDRMWSATHLTILTLWTAGLLLPHLRLWTAPEWVLQSAEFLEIDGWMSTLLMLKWIWLSGASALGLGVILSLIRTGMLIAVSEPVRGLFPSTRSLSGASKTVSGKALAMGNSRSEPAASAVGLTGDAGSRQTPGDLLSGMQIDIRISSMIRVPFCWQFHRPVVVLPRAVLSFPEAELLAILRHEVGHLQSRHPLQLFLQRMVEALFWFHPLIWICSRSAALQRELVADAWAAESRDDVAALLQSLLRLSRIPETQWLHLPSGLSFAGCRSLLEYRVNALLRRADRGDCRSPEWDLRKHFGILLVGLCGLLVSMLWLPLNPAASTRSSLAPWPEVSARALKELGFTVRDFEIDGHRVHGGPHAHVASR